jgi:hypothetical protein
MADTPEAQDPEEEKFRKEAKRLAESQGLKWKDLPKDRRRELKNQAKRAQQEGSGASSNRQS